MLLYLKKRYSAVCIDPSFSTIKSSANNFTIISLSFIHNINFW